MLSNSGKSSVEEKTTERIGRYAAVSQASRYEEPAHSIFQGFGQVTKLNGIMEKTPRWRNRKDKCIALTELKNVCTCAKLVARSC